MEFAGKPERTLQMSANSVRLKRELRDDLDNIILKALRKEPERRYASPEQFAEDIRRHLEGLPVSATPDSIAYRANKFVRRHNIGVAATALILIAVVTGVAATLREARIASENQRRAEKRFAEVRKLANSLIFEIHDSIAGMPGATAARQLIVQRSSEYLDSLAREASGDVSLQRELASAYERLGDVQGDMYGSNLGDPSRAVQSLKKALAMRQSIARANSRNVDDLVSLARAYQEIGRIQWFSLGGTDEGLQNLQQAVSTAEAAVHIDSQNMAAVEVLAQSHQYLGDIQGGSGLRGGTAYLHDALENHLKALPLLQKMADANPADVEKTYLLSRAAIGVGDDYVRMGDAAQALKSYERAEEILRPVAEKINNAVYRRGYAVCHTRIGDALLMSGRPAEALSHYRREREILKPLAAADPKDMAVQSTFTTSEGDIGHAMVEAGQVAEGKATLLRALSNTLALAKAAPDSYSRTLLASTTALAGEGCERGSDNRHAESYYGQALDLYLATMKADAADLEDAVNVAIMRNHLGGVQLKSGQRAKAMEQYQTALREEESLVAASPDNIETLYAMADTYSGVGDASAALAIRTPTRGERFKRFSEARDWYMRSLNVWQRIPTPAHVSPSLFQLTSPREVARRLSDCNVALAQTEPH